MPLLQFELASVRFKCGITHDCGVYKGQGRNQRELMTHAYWEFFVQGKQLQFPIPLKKTFYSIAKSFQDAHAACLIQISRQQWIQSVHASKEFHTATVTARLDHFILPVQFVAVYEV
ncbi:4-hydroxythreonine-4-phosphate dehydrogenase [Trichinella spiralis]|uniref:4-hydroxythreonine-4-phosphate dehydrogenase n=1 Tax=Trichinella spiralis TaxID=6334 RepID=A0ABR3KV50_TRISP